MQHIMMQRTEKREPPLEAIMPVTLRRGPVGTLCVEAGVSTTEEEDRALEVVLPKCTVDAELGKVGNVCLVIKSIYRSTYQKVGNAGEAFKGSEMYLVTMGYGSVGPGSMDLHGTRASMVNGSAKAFDVNAKGPNVKYALIKGKCTSVKCY